MTCLSSDLTSVCWWLIQDHRVKIPTCFSSGSLFGHAYFVGMMSRITSFDVIEEYSRADKQIYVLQ